MANKRTLKKLIQNTCGSLALDMVMAGECFNQINNEDIENVVVECGRLQVRTIGRLAVSFDRSRKEFADAHAYKEARHQYFRKAYTALLDQFNKEVAQIVAQMNKALPDEVREALKKIAAQ